MKTNLYPMRGRLYLKSKKYKEPTVCPKCGLVFTGGRWKRLEEKPEGEVNTELCPACKCIRDKYFAGVLRINSDLVKTKNEEIKNLIRNEEEKMQRVSPLRRIGKIEEDIEKGKMVIHTTFEHLATRIGKALARAYKGELEIKYKVGVKAVRVWWKR
ncbi:MAG: ATPase [Deltaproteobacteria bacterium]|nr:ATPase [Deltaproteobacteria bacterium]